MGIVDSAFGQGFGTIGTPVLLLFGIGSKTAVPLILFSQFILGLVSTFMHHRLKNVDFTNHKTHDSKRLYVFGITGLFAVIIASISGIKLPSIFVEYYIGTMVTIIEILLIINFKMKFTWLRMFFGIISAFNKGLAGGGYGPMVIGSQTITGINSKNSVGVTLSSVTLIFLVGFLTWILIEGLPPLNIFTHNRFTHYKKIGWNDIQIYTRCNNFNSWHCYCWISLRYKFFYWKFLNL